MAEENEKKDTNNLKKHLGGELGKRKNPKTMRVNRSI